LPEKIYAERQIARDSLENATFLVRAPKDVADKGRWSDHCYKVLPDLEQGGPIMVHRQLLQSNHTIVDHPCSVDGLGIAGPHLQSTYS
jgi:hypothetical protein